VEDMGEFKNLIGYVLQEDLMDFNKTPRELFEYYATLRGHPNPAESAEIIIKQMKIQKCADTIVGDNYRRGLSGGEKKRVSIGIELVSNPNLLFLDEPTTGLDSSTALDIITELK
jgi:ABC-type multidrug transport system ATPase subunit